jgi:protein-L-isoaspartate(D-aspartate) O-methyltransferase
MSLIDELINDGYLKTPAVKKAFRRVKRSDFTLSGDNQEAEVNAPLPIGHGQTISQPLTVAFMIELLDARRGDKVLDVGSGSGWTVALLSSIVGQAGEVYGLELIEDLYRFATSNVRKYNFIDSGIATIYCRSGYQGLPEKAPFDRIIVSAAASAAPKALLSQLRIGGRMVLPIGPSHESQDIVALTKITEDRFNEQRYPGFVFVPLVDK